MPVAGTSWAHGEFPCRPVVTETKRACAMIRTSIGDGARAAAAGVAAVFFLVSPGQAVTCTEVKTMSKAELAQWAERLQVAPADLTALLQSAFCDPGAN